MIATQTQCERTDTSSNEHQGGHDMLLPAGSLQASSKQEERRVIPVFESHEIKSGLYVGIGTFGIVSEVTQIKGNFGAILKEFCPNRGPTPAPLDMMMGKGSAHSHNSLAVLMYGSEHKLSVPAGPTTGTIAASDRMKCSLLTEDDHCSIPGEDNTDDTFLDYEESERISPSSLVETLEENGQLSYLDISLKSVLSQTVKRDEGCGRYRYAVKRLRTDLRGDMREIGVDDLATEASLLQSISHPNIVRLRAMVGTPGSPDFMLVLDRLYDTVTTRIQHWKKNLKGGVGTIRLFTGKKMRKNLGDRLAVAYDIARAFRYLHKRRIVHRDLKPDNAAFNIRGNVRLFDFGLAREIHSEKLIERTDGYLLTELAGSPRWMAPEVHRKSPYGLSSDVYSFGLFLWNLCSLQVPYGRKLTMKQLQTTIIPKRKRPRRLHFVPDTLNSLMSQCWSDDPSERPSFDQICTDLQNEKFTVEVLCLGGNLQLLDRTRHLVDHSTKSLLSKLPKDSERSSANSVPIAAF